jgi:hypothetical protein
MENNMENKQNNMENNMKILYTRLPKNASTSIQSILTDKGFDYIEDKKVPNNNIIIEPLRLIRNKTISSSSLDGNLYKEYSKILNMDEYYKISFVRNPWDRAVSSWEFLMRHPHKPNQKASDVSRKHGEIDFENFLLLLKKEGFKNLSDRDKWHIAPQFEYLSLNGELMYDFIGKYENLHNDIKEGFKSINLNENDVPHLMKSNHTSYKDYYNDNCINLVGELFKSDIDNFGYNY